jgi:polar amino acid transport system substrate-binding protein
MKKITLLLLILSFGFNSFSNDIITIDTFITDTIVIGINEAPPFVIENDGILEGLNIEIIENTLGKYAIPYKYVLYKNIPDVIDALDKGEIDLMATSTTVTAERFKKINFSHPYFHTDIAIITIKQKSSFLTTLGAIFSKNVLKILMGLLTLLIVLGFIVWLCERNKNDQFRKDWKGIFDGTYFMAVVMTTVGFGDKAAKSPIGKFLVVIWMFVALGITGIFIGGISSSLTINSMNNGIESVSDLSKLKVGTISNTTPAYFLDKHEIKYLNYKSVSEGIKDMKDGNLDAFVYDRPILIYYNNLNDNAFTITEKGYIPQTFAFGFNYSNNILKNSFNILLLEYMENNNWKKSLNKYNLKK